jgi:hypothetical protein
MSLGLQNEKKNTKWTFSSFRLRLKKFARVQKIPTKKINSIKYYDLLNFHKLHNHQLDLTFYSKTN